MKFHIVGIAIAFALAGCGMAVTPVSGRSPSSSESPAPTNLRPKWSQVGGTLNPLSGQAIVGITIWAGHIVAATTKEVWINTASTWQGVSLPSPLSNSAVTAVTSTTRGIWVAAYGVGRYGASHTWKQYNPGPNGPSTISSMATSGASQLVILPTLGESSPWEWNGAHWSVLSGLQTALGGMGFAYAVALSSTGTPFIGTSEGVWQWMQGAWSPVGGASNPLVTRQVLTLATDASGGCAAYVGSLGVIRFHGGAWESLGEEPASLLRQSGVAMLFTTTDSLVVGTASGAVWEYTAGSWKTLGRLNGPISTISALPNGNLVAATGSGVWVYGTP